MANWVATDKGGREYIYYYKPVRLFNYWAASRHAYRQYCILPKGTIERIIGYKLTWEDEAVKL